MHQMANIVMQSSNAGAWHCRSGHTENQTRTSTCLAGMRGRQKAVHRAGKMPGQERGRLQHESAAQRAQGDLRSIPGSCKLTHSQCAGSEPVVLGCQLYRLCWSWACSAECLYSMAQLKHCCLHKKHRAASAQGQLSFRKMTLILILVAHGIFHGDCVALVQAQPLSPRPAAPCSHQVSCCNSVVFESTSAAASEQLAMKWQGQPVGAG